MNKTRLFASCLLAVSAAVGIKAQNTPASQMERLDRGLVVVPATTSSYNFISWRLFGTDDDNTTFDILRNGKDIVGKNLAEKTNYVDKTGTTSSTYQVITKHDGVATDTTEAVSRWGNIYKTIEMDRPAGGTLGGSAYTYSPNDCSVGDVDGDGQYEIIVKWDPSNSQDNSKSGYTGNVYIDCYRLDGTKLWRIDLGKNIRAGAHYTQFLVYDFDGDGRAEMICKTAPGSIDGGGAYVSEAATDEDIKTVNNAADYRNSDGKITGGQEYLTVFNGLTGKAIHTIFYNPNRAIGYGGAATWTFNWDDRSGKTDKEYGNRGERYLATVAYLDGADKRPSAVMCRGYYTYAFLWAVDFDGTQLKQKWFHASKSKTAYSVTDSEGNTTSYTANKATRGAGSNTAYGNGNHNLACADVDCDGCDEILWGSCGIDHDGKMLYATGYGHGDANHLSDLIPDRPGLEMFDVHEESPYGWDVHDAATGEILLSATGKSDNGRGMSADVDLTNRGFEFWSANDKTIRSATTGDKALSDDPASYNFRVYWDGDILDELFDGGKLEKQGSGRIYPISGKNFYDFGSCCNGSKATPNLTADILGDWREEIILHTDNTLVLFTTNVESDFRVPTLMHDHVYRLGVAWENVAYNQPPHLGYYLPDLFQTIYANVDGAGEMTQRVVLGDSIQTICRHWKYCASPSLIKSIAPDGKEYSNKVMDGFTFKRDVILKKTFTLSGKPSQIGTYRFIIQSGKNKVDESVKNDTITIECISSQGIEVVTDKADQTWCNILNSTIADKLTLRLTASGTVNAALYDATGKRMASRKFNATGSETHTIGGLGNLPSGVYMISVETADKKMTAKVVKL